MQLYSNNASTTLAAPLSSSGTSMTVASAALFPSSLVAGQDWFIVTLQNIVDDLVTASEIVKVTAVAGVTWTIVRDQEGTGALAWVAGNTVAMLNTAGTMANLLQQQQPNSTESADISAPILIYAKTPTYDVRRAGVVGNGSTDDTANFQAAVNYCYSQGARLILPENFNILTTGISLTFTGNRTNNSLQIEGASQTGSKITQKSSANTILTFQGSSGTAPSEANLTLANFSLVAPRTTGTGLFLENLALWVAENVDASGFNVGVQLSSALVGKLINCDLYSNNYGVKAGFSPGNTVYNNLVSLIGCPIKFNNLWAVYFARGSELLVDNCDIESNGTLGNSFSGAIYLDPSMSSEIGLGKAMIKNSHLEANTGGYAIQTGAMTKFLLSIEETEIIDSNAGLAFQFQSGGSGNMVMMKNTYSPSPGDTWTVAADTLCLRNVDVAILNDSGVLYPDYGTYATSNGTFSGSRIQNYPFVLTGFSGAAPSGTLALRQSGREVKVEFPQVTGASNSTSMTAVGDFGTATGGSTTTLQDTSKSWTVNQWAGYVVYDITTGLGATVVSNTSNTLTFAALGSAVASGNSYQISVLPAALTTPNNVNVQAFVENSGLGVNASVNLTGFGQMTFSTANFGSFASSGTKGVLACIVPWLI